MTNPTPQQITQWREKALTGTLTQEELREAIIHLRQNRISACFASEGARTKKPKKAPKTQNKENPDNEDPF